MSTQVFIDATDVTNLSLSGSSTRRLNRMSQAQVRLPMDSAVGGVGSKLRIYFDGTLHHHGIVMLCETEAGEDTGYTTYNSRDPLDIWQWRPVRDSDGDYSFPGITWDPGEPPTDKFGPDIIYYMALNSENASTPSDYSVDGPLYLDIDTGPYETCTTDLTFTPTDFPMTMADMASLYTSTGQVDIVVVPIETDGNGNIGRLEAYCGKYGTDRTASVIFQYGMGAYNIRSLRHNVDATNVVSKLRYLLGPKRATRTDPDANQHWWGSVEWGGVNVEDRCGYEARGTAIESTYGGRFDIEVFDGLNDDENIGTSATPAKKLLWLELFSWEACLRTVPRELVHITPTRESEIFTFDIGDVITVEAVSAVNGGFSGEQRVYEYTISWDVDGVRALSELVTSPDQEDITA